MGPSLPAINLLRLGLVPKLRDKMQSLWAEAEPGGITALPWDLAPGPRLMVLLSVRTAGPGEKMPLPSEKEQMPGGPIPLYWEKILNLVLIKI